MEKAVILGATAPLAGSVARRFAAAGYQLVLGARNVTALRPLAAEIESTLGMSAEILALDVLDSESRSTFLAAFRDEAPAVVISLLGRQEDLQCSRDDPEYIEALIAGNLIAPMIMLEAFAELLQSARSGMLVGVSSIVGDRGRQRNYTYGAGKAGLNVFLSGLRQRMAPSGVHVMTVKPGVIASPGRDARVPSFLVTTADVVAADILAAIATEKSIVYTPWFWRWIMWLVRLIPERCFRWMRF